MYFAGVAESQVVHFAQFWSSDTLDGPKMHPEDADRMQTFLGVLSIT
jgi:hypothetical protein